MSPVTFNWSDCDTRLWITVGAPLGLGVGALLAAFGMPPVDLHLPFHRMGIMDPFCGMTRGVAALLRGDTTAALRFNPASPLVALAGALGVVRAWVGVMTHRWFDVHVRWTRPVVAAAAVALIALEIRQQLNVELLTS